MTVTVNSSVSGSGGGGSSVTISNGGYLGEVASTSGLVSLSEAIVGSTANVGVTSDVYILYELMAEPYSTEANWQPLQGTIPDGTEISITLVEGKFPRQLLVWVAAATEVTVSDGTSTFVLIPSIYPHLLPIYDEVGEATPTTLTIQRTSGSATTGRYSLEG